MIDCDLSTDQVLRVYECIEDLEKDLADGPKPFRPSPDAKGDRLMREIQDQEIYEKNYAKHKTALLLYAKSILRQYGLPEQKKSYFRRVEQ